MTRRKRWIIGLAVSALAVLLSVFLADRLTPHRGRISARVHRLLDRARPPGTVRRWLSRLRSPSPADGKPTLIEGSCKWGLPVGSLSDYWIPLRAKDNSLGYIRVRSEAVWYLEDLSNVLGIVPCGTVLWGQGPLKRCKEAGGSAGIGYAVAVQDARGNMCRGYVSGTVVDVTEE